MKIINDFTFNLINLIRSDLKNYESNENNKEIVLKIIGAYINLFNVVNINSNNNFNDSWKLNKNNFIDFFNNNKCSMNDNSLILLYMDILNDLSSEFKNDFKNFNISYCCKLIDYLNLNEKDIEDIFAVSFNTISFYFKNPNFLK